MSKLRICFVALVIFLYSLYLTSFDRIHQVILLLVILGLMILLSLIEYKESITKLGGLMKFEIRLTRGFAYCIGSLPVVYILWDSRHFEIVRYQLIVYIITLLFAIFNYGIKSESGDSVNSSAGSRKPG